MANYEFHNNSGSVRCIGVGLFGHEPVNVFTRSRSKWKPCIEIQEFVYYQEKDEKDYDLSTALTIVLQIVGKIILSQLRKLKYAKSFLR